MVERLNELFKLYKLKVGKNAKVKLCASADIHPATLDNVLGKRTKPYNPQPSIVYRIALACGATEEEARTLSDACPSEAKVSA